MLKILLIVGILMLALGCSDDSSKRVMVKKGSVNKSSINLDVTAELGGEGFEKVAESLGYKTNEEYRVIGSKDAKRGGTFTRYIGEYPLTHRCVGKDSHDASITMISSLVYESLLNLDIESKSKMPLLATHWKTDLESNTFYFRIDPLAKWSDGKPVTSADVVATWELMTDEGILAPYTTESYFKFEKPVALSPYLVSVKAKEKDFSLFNSFSYMSILPAHHLKKINGTIFIEKYNWQMIPGTGPYLLDQNKTRKGQKLVYKRRDNYWGDQKRFGQGYANFDNIVFDVVRDNVLTREKFKKGELDVLAIGAKSWRKDFNPINPEPPFDPVERGLVQKKEIHNYNPSGISGLAINMRKAPFDDIRVRRAFAHLLNRDLINEKIYYGDYGKINSIYPGSIYENPNNFKVEYDPNEANKLLDQAGWRERDSEGFRVKNGQKFIVDLDITQSSEKIYTIYQEELEKAGVKLNLKYSDWNSMVKRIHERRFSIINMGYTGTITPNPWYTYRSDLADKLNTNNICGVKDERIDLLCKEYKENYSLSERVEILQEIDSLVTSKHAWIFGWFRPYTQRIVYWNKFGMPETTFSPTGDEDSIMLYWWVDEKREKELEKAKGDKNIDFEKEEILSDYWSMKK